ncbi:MAG: hypothetical protein Q9169_007977, partial [Polycauliona sp. 2 TL-2023]
LAIFAVFAICAIVNVATNFTVSTISPTAGITIPTTSTSMASTPYLLLVLLITHEPPVYISAEELDLFFGPPATVTPQPPQTTYVDAEELDRYFPSPSPSSTVRFSGTSGHVSGRR